ncbi:MAG TPA: efflux RND transporter permease subunit [Gemmatimonadaceae bacterium]|nr:efflux RND transporter permease subunit [Gemmatimonadaceae bacterium]
MFISDFAIKKPIVTIVSMVALVVFGLFSLAQLQTDEFPDVVQPIVNVAIPYPGASPDVVEREVLDRVEEAVAGISGVDRMQGTAQDGFANLTVYFVFEKDVQQASQDIRDKISAIRDQLPAEMKEPILSRFDPQDQAIVQLSLNSNALDAPSLTRLADPGMTKELRAIPGVAEAVVVGGVERELTVEIRPDAMRAARISVGQLVGALQSQNLAVPVGKLTGALDERSIRLRGKLETPADFLQLVVAERNGHPIRLGEVATARDGTIEPVSAAIYGDSTGARESIGILIKKSKGYSTSQVSRDVLDQVHAIQATLPRGTTLSVIQNAGERVEASVKNVNEALLEGAALTVLVVFLFLNSWRSTVITGLALPVSVISAFIAVWAFGFTLNTMSLLGLSLAIGILIDDAIVVRENIVRHVEMGKNHFKASHDGTNEIGLAVAATTFSIVAVFVPIAFMGDVPGQWFKPFALTIACAVLVSLFVSFSLDPMLSAYWADPHKAEHEKSFITRALDRFNHWFNRQADRYTGLIGWALDHRWSMVALATLSFVVAIYIQATYVGGGFVPNSDRSEVFIEIQTPAGSNLDYTKMKTEEVARIARAHRDLVAYTFSTIGASTIAIPGASIAAADLGSLYVRMVHKADRHMSQYEFGELLRGEMAQVSGAEVAVYTSGFGGARKQIQLELRGKDAVVLNRIADSVAKLVKTVPGAVDVGLSSKGQKPELEIQLNRDLAGSLGVTVGQVAQALRPAFAGVDAGDWVDPSGENRKVRVRLAPEARRRAADIQQLPIVVGGQGGTPEQVMPLGQIASIRPSLGPAVISHLDRENVVVIEANTQGQSLAQVNAAIQAKIAGMTLPTGYGFSSGGEVRDQEKVYTKMFFAMGVAVLLMYLVLVVQFSSFLEPLAIMASLPLSLIGVVLALWITGDNLNIMSLIGVLMLMGIVAKNAILLIDFAKWGQEEGKDRRTAIIEAGRVRLRPIMMTTIALIAGMIPVALGRGEGADFRAPLGRAIIGGVITSTLLTLLVIPTVYEILDDWRIKLAGLFKFPQRPKTEEYAIPREARASARTSLDNAGI